MKPPSFPANSLWSEQRMLGFSVETPRTPDPEAVRSVPTTNPEVRIDSSNAVREGAGSRVARAAQGIAELLAKLQTNPPDEQKVLLQKLGKIIRKMLGRPGSPEQGPQQPQQQIEQLQDGTRLEIAQVLGADGKRLDANVQSAVTEAQHRFGLSVDQYQQRVMMAPGEPETPEKFCRPLLSPPSPEPKELVIMTGGNNEPLTQERDRRGSERGQMYMYNRFATERPPDVDVLQFRVGKLTAENPTEQNSVASIHIQNIINDALAGRGQFVGRIYKCVKMFGYSYGAGHSLLLADQLAQRKAAGQNVPPVTQTAFVDGIQFQSVPPKAVDRQPTSGQHFQVWQKGKVVDIHGGPVGSPGANVTQRPIDGTTHQNINDARQQGPLFDEIYGKLRA